ncbi:MAG: hemin receptor [Flammeovirgaceae bacterium]
MYSQHIYGGTARFQSLGGANVSLGGDISSALMNPAGLGFMRSSELTVSLAYGNYQSTSKYSLVYPNNPYAGSNSFDEAKGNVNFNQLGVVFNIPSETNNDFYGGSFAVSYTRIADFHGHFTYEGINDTTSIVDYFTEISQGTPTDYFEEQGQLGITDPRALAYYTYLINPEFSGNQNTSYYSFLPIVPTSQREEVISKGAHYEWSFAYGGNYKDMLYFGAKLGIQSLNRSLLKQYKEEIRYDLLPSNVDVPLDNLFLEEDINISGYGINASAGMIFRPIDAFRVGINAVTPTSIRISEDYKATLNTQYNNFRFDSLTVLNDESASTDNVITKYTVVSPARLSVGTSIFIAKKGFLTADIEYVDYTNIKIRNANVDGITNDNSLFKTNMTERVNIRLGAEVRIDPVRIRAGYAHYPNPNANTSNENARKFYSGGVGIRKDNFFADFMLQFTSKVNSQYTPYSLENAAFPTVNVQSNRARATFTVGFIF